MNKFVAVLSVFCALVFTSYTPANAKAPDAATSGGFADVVENLLPAVVNISSTQHIDTQMEMPEMPQFPEGSPFQDFFEEFMENRQGMPVMPQASLGSGFVIDAENGYIITNNHVIRDAEEIRVTFHDDVTIPATLIGTDDKTDLAVLKVETDHKLYAVEFGDSDHLRVGDWVVAIGNPFGLGGTVTAGIVSARQRDINAGPYDDFIQTDASINRGNSGGPMFDLNGKVIGINTAIFSPSGGSVGIGFAIPSALAQPIINQIIKYGRTRRGWLGVRIQEVTEDIAESLGMPKAQGALVASVTPGGPAEAAGIEAGDVLLEFDDKTISAMRSLPRLVAESEIGTSSPLVFWREGKALETSVMVGELEKAEDEGLLESGDLGPVTTDTGTEIPVAGMKVSRMNDTLRMNYAIPPSVQGVVVTSVDPMGEAGEKGLFEGDVIVEVNQSAVANPDDLQAAFDAAMASGKNSALLLVNREGDVRFLALKLEAPKEEEKPKSKVKQ